MIGDRKPRQQRVLVALDGSEFAGAALPVASALAGQLHAELEAIYVVPQPGKGADPRKVLGLDSPRFQSITVKMRVGDPADEILDEAATANAAVVVVTTFGAGERRDRDLGRTAEAIVRRRRGPTLLIGPSVSPERLTARVFRRALLPLDASRDTSTALLAVAALVSRLDLEVDILHVVAGGPRTSPVGSATLAPRYVDQPQHEWQQWDDELRVRLGQQAPGFPTERVRFVHLERGDPVAEVAHYSRQGTYDVIILVRTSLFEEGRAKVLRSVFKQAACPILIVSDRPD